MELNNKNLDTAVNFHSSYNQHPQSGASVRLCPWCEEAGAYHDFVVCTYGSGVRSTMCDALMAAR